MTTRAKHNRSHSIERAHTAPLLLASLCVLLILVVSMLTATRANAASTSIRVTAQVLPWLDVSATPIITSYRVDAEALQKGFIDLPNSLSIQLATNLRSDIDLNLSSFGPERILVSNGSSHGSDMFRIAAPDSNVYVTRAVDLRVILPPGIAQGDYPLLLNVSAINI